MPGRPRGTLRKVRALMNAVEGLWNDLATLKKFAPALAETGGSVEGVFESMSSAYTTLSELESALVEKVPDELDKNPAAADGAARSRNRLLGRRGVVKTLNALSDRAHAVSKEAKWLAEGRLYRPGMVAYAWGATAAAPSRAVREFPTGIQRVA